MRIIMRDWLKIRHMAAERTIGFTTIRIIIINVRKQKSCCGRLPEV